jgi:hypothetical protein
VDPNHGHEAMQHAAMAAALSHPFFLAAAAASSRDVNHSSIEQSSAPRIPSYDDHHHHHHHLQSSPTNKFFERSSSTTIKRSFSPSFLSKQQNDDNNNINSPMKKLATTINNFPSPLNIRSSCFTPVTTTTTNTSSLLSPVSKLKIIAKGNTGNIVLIEIYSFWGLENNPEQQSAEKSITISIELNGIAYQGTLYATAFNGNKD